MAHPTALLLSRATIGRAYLRVAEIEGELVGFAELASGAEGTFEIEGLFVDPAHWRMGIGRILTTDLIDYARTRGADTVYVTANPHALGFYEALGFEAVGSVRTQLGSGTRMRLRCRTRIGSDCI